MARAASVARPWPAAHGCMVQPISARMSPAPWKNSTTSPTAVPSCSITSASTRCSGLSGGLERCRVANVTSAGLRCAQQEELHEVGVRPGPRHGGRILGDGPPEGEPLGADRQLGRLRVVELGAHRVDPDVANRRATEAPTVVAGHREQDLVQAGHAEAAVDGLAREPARARRADPRGVRRWPPAPARASSSCGGSRRGRADAGRRTARTGSRPIRSRRSPGRRARTRGTSRGGARPRRPPRCSR